MLTDRQRQVLTLLARGKTQREIAHQLELTYGYVRDVVYDARKRMDARTTTQAVVLAWRHNEIQVKE